jgi:hypothetical protein
MKSKNDGILSFNVLESAILWQVKNIFILSSDA